VNALHAILSSSTSVTSARPVRNLICAELVTGV
jgi:hypothetical protein